MSDGELGPLGLVRRLLPLEAGAPFAVGLQGMGLQGMDSQGTRVAALVPTGRSGQ